MAVSTKRFEFTLEQLKPSDWERFEQLCSIFLAAEFTGLRTMASPGGDRGRDAELYVFSHQPNVLFQYSVTENWSGKIDTTITRLEQEFPSVKNITFLSSQKIGAKGDEAKIKARQKGVSLDIRDRSWFIERVNESESRQTAAEELAKLIVDPILEIKGLKQADSSLRGADLRTALTFLELQAKDEDSSKGLTKSCFESLVRAALAGSDANNPVSRANVHKTVQEYLPQHAPHQITPFVDAALKRLEKTAIKHRPKDDKFHISFEEQEKIKEKLAELEFYRARFREDIQDISHIVLEGNVPNQSEIENTCTKIIQEYFYKQGEDFADAVANDKIPPIQNDLLKLICEQNSPNGKINHDTTWVDFSYSITSSLLINGSENTFRYLNMLSTAYTLFAFLSSTPDVQKVTKKLFDQGSLWIDTTVLLPLFSERAFPEDMRPFTDLMLQLKRSGLQLFVTKGVVEEIERHLNLCKTYLNTTPWQGRVPYVYQKYAMAGKGRGAFNDWVGQFMGEFMPLDDIAEFLEEAAGIQQSVPPSSDKIPDDVVSEIRTYWQEIQEKRRQSRESFSIAANRLAAHDAENYIAVLSQRHREAGKSMLGYTSWLVTLDSAAAKLIDKVDTQTKSYIQHSPVISLDFLLKYLSFGPRRDQITSDGDGHVKIFTSAIFEAISPELIKAAEEVRKSYGTMDERQLQRRIRDGLNKQRLKAGAIQEAGLDGMEKAMEGFF